MAVLTPRHSNYRSIHKKYTVGSTAGLSAKTDTLAEAKKAGEAIARKEAWRGKWNVAYIAVSIRKADGPASYGKPVLTMYVPVRGSGMTADAILAMLKKREGVTPFKWKKGR